MTQRIVVDFQEIAAKTLNLLQKPEGVCRECPVPYWYYDLRSLRPRAYGRCRVCSSIHVLVLPEQVPPYRQWSPLYRGLNEFPENPEAVAASVIESLEPTLMRPGIAQSLHAGHHGVLPGSGLAQVARDLVEKVKEQEAIRETEHRALVLRLSDQIHEAMSAREANSRRARKRAKKTRDLAAPSRSVLCDSAQLGDVVYGLVASDEPERIRYVGRTSNPGGRYIQHLKAGAPAIREWMAAVALRNARVLMLELERCRPDVVADAEQDWIRRSRATGQADLNTSLPMGQRQDQP